MLYFLCLKSAFKIRNALNDVQKQKNPSNTEITALKNMMVKLDELKVKNKNDPVIYCKNPHLLLQTNYQVVQ